MKKRINKQAITLTLDTVYYLFPKAFRYKPSYFLLAALDIILSIIHPFINIFFPKFLIDELIGNMNLKLIITYLIVLVLGNIGLSYLLSIISTAMSNIDDLFERYFNQQLSLHVMKMKFEYTEDPQILDGLQRAKTGMDWYSGGVGGIVGCIKNIISSFVILVGVISVLALKAPLVLVVIVLFVFLISVFEAKRNNVGLKYYDQLSKMNRGFDYVFSQLSDFKYGKDIRLYNAEEMMVNKANQYNKDLSEIFHKEADELFRYDFVKNMFSGVYDGIIYIYIGLLALTKMITIGDFTMLLTSSQNFNGSLQSIIGGIQDIYKRCRYAHEYVAFMKNFSCLEKGKKKVQETKQHTIEFKNVSFRYPRSEEYALENISICIHSNEKLSIVGANGAGKTTFIKLLCGLYPVTVGEILLDGTNISEYDSAKYMKLFSVVFQDFKLFTFSLKENICLNKEVNQNRLDFLTERLGLKNKVASLPNGFNTSIYKSFDECGFVPSGGEQQKIAIARAWYLESPFAILDEPTASLDPMAEHEIYQNFNDLTENKMVIYISHRLSSCQFCDSIAVFDHGRIVESGTHEQLRSYNGIYRKMFDQQAKYYN